MLCPQRLLLRAIAGAGVLLSSRVLSQSNLLRCRRSSRIDRYFHRRLRQMRPWALQEVLPKERSPPPPPQQIPR
ncbi:hypothetical protein FB451DRAFT_1283454 [Mycena latifolia]|nr:hypothetical protein FB451DRAFT_1283454 [Mycena latifolia]